MMMACADATVRGCAIAKARADGAVGVETPLADVTIPTGGQFAHEHNLAAFRVESDAAKGARVVACVEDGRGDGRAAIAHATVCAGHVCAVGDEHVLLISPITIGAAHVAV